MEKRYFITDASKMVDVESHVLRYWEEELLIDIPRNEMGHRYYTDFHIKLMKKVKELKAEGLQLKAIRNIIPEIKSFEDLIDNFNGKDAFGNCFDADFVAKLKEGNNPLSYQPKQAE